MVTKKDEEKSVMARGTKKDELTKDKVAKVAKAKKEEAKKNVTPDISKRGARALLADNFTPKNTDENVSPNHRDRGLTRGEKRKARDAYTRRKAQVYEVEQDNHKLLIIFKASSVSRRIESQYYILGGNSAVIFAGDIGGRLNRSPKLRADTDNGKYKFENGVVFVRNLPKLMKELEALGLKRQKLSKQWADDEIVCYRLNREYTDAEIRGILKEREAELEKNNNTIYPKVVYPEVHKYIITISDYMLPKVIRLDSNCREVIGRDIANTVMKLTKTYSRMMRGEMSNGEGRYELLCIVDDLFALVKIMMDLGKWELSSCARMGEQIDKLRRAIKATITQERGEGRLGDMEPVEALLGDAEPAETSPGDAELAKMPSDGNKA